MKNHLIKLLASFGYLGYVPLMPGTAASFVTLIFYFFFRGNFLLYTLFLLFVSVAGFWVSAPAEKIFGRKDADRIVIDEAAGVLLAFWALPPIDTVLLVAGFFIFRALDALKPYPANRIERLSGSLGVMGDDLLAGFYTNIVLQIVTRIFCA